MNQTEADRMKFLQENIEFFGARSFSNARRNRLLGFTRSEPMYSPRRCTGKNSKNDLPEDLKQYSKFHRAYRGTGEKKK